MKLATFAAHGETKLGVVAGEGIIDLSAALPEAPREMIGLVEAWRRWKPAVEQAAQSRAHTLHMEDVALLAPILRPRKVLAIGLNYADHIAESRFETPQHQVWFCKQPTSINGPYAPIEIPTVSQAIDYEAELVAVIGREARHISKDEAAAAVFGYMAGNDVSVRDWQRLTPQWMLGKSFDTHAPIGPWITTADEIEDPHALGIRCLVNGEVRQNSNTRNLVFNAFDQIAYVSQAMTLEPGDLIFTGTPGGVGAAMKPPQFLKPGDRVRVEIDRLGHIEGSMIVEAR